jgi:hypothetical protein
VAFRNVRRELFIDDVLRRGGHTGRGGGGLRAHGCRRTLNPTWRHTLGHMGADELGHTGAVQANLKP